MIRVNVDQLNLRSAPDSKAEESVVAVLRRGQLLSRVGEGSEGWWRVRVPLMEGYVAARHVLADDSLDVGAGPAADDEPGPPYRVNTALINLRSHPESASTETVVAVLRRGQKLWKLDEAADGWWFVRVPMGGGPIEGFLASRYLAPADARVEGPDLGTFVVNADGGVNLRATTSTADPGNVLQVLPRGKRVMKLAAVDGTWCRVRADVGDGNVEGFVAARYLSALDGTVEEPADTPATGAIPAVHLRPKGRTENETHRAFPLEKEPFPREDSSAAKVRRLVRIIEFLDVERSARYRKTPGTTFCNIYAYDYCYLSRVYLPRVWWMERALRDLSRGEPVRPVYARTLRELNANALYEWLLEWGDDYGWVRTDSPAELQDAANEGNVAVICARREDRNRSGHISVVAPEHEDLRAGRTAGTVVNPLQSQAGAANFAFKVPPQRWWDAPKFDGFGFWYTQGTRESIPA